MLQAGHAFRSGETAWCIEPQRSNALLLYLYPSEMATVFPQDDLKCPMFKSLAPTLPSHSRSSAIATLHLANPTFSLGRGTPEPAASELATGSLELAI